MQFFYQYFSWSLWYQLFRELLTNISPGVTKYLTEPAMLVSSTIVRTARSSILTLKIPTPWNALKRPISVLADVTLGAAPRRVFNLKDFINWWLKIYLNLYTGYDFFLTFAKPVLCSCTLESYYYWWWNYVLLAGSWPKLYVVLRQNRWWYRWGCFMP